MRVVIIGGKGMIGTAVTNLAVSRGHEVVVLTRQSLVEGGSRGGRIIAQWDGSDAKSLTKHIEGCDVVINLAGESIGNKRWTTTQKDRLLQSRLQPAKALVQAVGLCITPPSKLVQASAIGYYGTGVDPRDEDSQPGLDYLAKFAVDWEKSTQDVEMQAVKRVVIRTGIVLSRGGGALQRLMLPFRLMVGGPIGSGQQIYSWIHLADVGGAIIHLMEKPDTQGVYNLTSPQPLSNAEFGRILSRVMKKPYWLPVPGIALKLVLGEMSTLVLDGQNVLPVRLQETGYKFRYPTLEPALRDLITSS